MALAKPIDLRIVTDVQRRRFWGRVDKTPGYGPKGECWLWKGGVGSAGYGRLNVGSKTDGTWREVRAHRFSYALAYIDVVFGAQDLVCHECDVCLCVNPPHLWIGTNADNSVDCVTKGRVPRGENCMSTRVTDMQVLAIRERVDLSHSEAGRKFGLSSQHVCVLRQGKYREEIGGIQLMSSYKKGRPGPRRESVPF